MKVGLYMTFNGAGGFKAPERGQNCRAFAPLSRKAANTTVVLGGVVVISGPTENALYRLGRRLPGNRYTGDDHVSNIGSVEAECRLHGSVQRIATLHRALPLFRVFSLQFDK
jgi:hypothetical protein